MKMKIEFRLSRIMLVITTFCLILFLIRNADHALFPLCYFFAASVYILSLPSTVVSRWLIGTGDKILLLSMKVMYYLTLPIASAIFSMIVYYLGLLILDRLPVPSDYYLAFGQALLFLLIFSLCAISTMLPSIQSLIVLALRRIIRSDHSLGEETVSYEV